MVSPVQFRGTTDENLQTTPLSVRTSYNLCQQKKIWGVQIVSAISCRETYIIDLARGCAANGVSDTNPVDANLVNRTVKR